MVRVSRILNLRKMTRCGFLTKLLLAGTLLSAIGCGQTYKPVVSPATGQVDTYFGGPFLVGGSPVSQPSAASFDHYANQIAVSSTVASSSSGASSQVPVDIINATFTSADTGFLSITESYTTTSTGIPSAQNPPVTGAWAVEIPGAGTLANFLSVYTQTTPPKISAAPTAMTQNTACPDSTTPSPYLYVTVPYAGKLTADTADYGIVEISSLGSAVTFSAQPVLAGAGPQSPSIVTGGCSQTIYGNISSYPLNTYGTSGPLPELISIGTSGLLVSDFDPALGGLGAFGGGTGVIGVAVPSSPVNVSSVVSAQYNGFIFSPDNRLQQSNGYDITVLASAFGNRTATSQTCSTLQASLAANNGPGGSVPILPSANSIYGGEFLTVSSTGSVNDPTGALGSENCDVVIDLGNQDPNTNGLFPNAAVFIGSNFPPFSPSNPWTCGGSGVCAVYFPVAAIVGQVQGQFVIFVTGSTGSTPPAQLPFGTAAASQPVGIYLFQKM